MRIPAVIYVHGQLTDVLSEGLLGDTCLSGWLMISLLSRGEQIMNYQYEVLNSTT